MAATGLMLRGLRTLYARRPETVIDVIADLGARAVGDGLIATAASDELACATRDLLSRCPDPSRLPLWGIPVAIGDTLDVAGLETTHGLPALAELAEADAPAVARLRAAGAIIMGKTAVSPLGIDDAASGALAAINTGLVSLVLTTDRSGTGLAAAARSGLAALMPTAADDVGSAALLYLAADADTLATVTPASAAAADLVAANIPAGLLADLAALADNPALLARDFADFEALHAELPQLFGPVRRRLDRAFAARATELARALARRDRLGRDLRAVLDAVGALVCAPDFTAAPGMAGLPVATLTDGRLLIGPADSDGALIATARRFAGPDRDASPGPIDIASSSPLALCALSDLPESSGRQEIAP